ncbi:hypothetical protein LI328DRAFT_165631 [Trichoderma asperelloides]|nr:hypothetical protein LI328DRAFT_165631 [Trichoderma asperelloides]
MAKHFLSSEMLEYAFHHIFLPPKLPNGDDRSPANESCLIELVRDSLTEFLPKTDASNHDAIKSAVAMMKNMYYVTGPDGYLQEDGVRAVLKQIGPHSPSKSLASLHITAQNAGVMLRLDNDSVIFEMFELCPTSGSVYSTKGRLIRQFPAVAVGIPVDIYAENDFQDVLAKTFVKMSYQTVSEALPKTKKAQQYHAEERDTVDPKIVTELLYGFLRGVGSEADVTGITKNTREEVLWKQSKLPWRRSAVWLLIRVSLQLTLDRVVGSEELYKSFIIFLLSRVLNAATNGTMDSEILMTMSTKISRRLLKLRHPANGTWLTDVHETVSIATKFVNARWYRIRNEAKSQFDLTNLQNLNMAGDTSISIPGLKDFISSISERHNGSQVSPFCPKSGITAFGPEEIPSIPGQVDKNERPFYLAMVESWVATHLSDWINKHFEDDSACIDLFTLIQNYHALGRSWYSSRPEGASRMILVILELWVAADKAAIHEFPLLKNYEHEIPIEVFQSLLLVFRKDMERLHLVQTYLTTRRDLARPKQKLSIFSSYGRRGSFPVEYFSQSPAHQNLLREIEARAYLEKQAKLKEYRLRRVKYDTFMQRYEQGVCESVGWEEDGVWYTEHASDCKRCAYRTKAVNLSINIYEWPLSSSPLEAQATVFELALPESFGAWRDGTLYVIDDVLQSMRSQNGKLQSEYPLRSYAGLSEFFRSNTRRRIHLLSESKPHVVTHRNTIKIGHSTESDVCVNNGLQLRYFDENRRTFVEKFTASTWDLKQLKRFLAPNAVIASQAFCPENMSLGEYKALATLPFGYRLQWMSILTQLAMPDVDFNKFETAIFLLQISLQAGPNKQCVVERCAHGRLTDAEFGHAMLDKLQGCVSRIKENWESHTAMWIFVFLAARLLSMTTTPALKLKISYKWLARLRSRAYDSPNEDERVQFLQIAFRVSLAAILIEISIDINNNTSLVEKDQDALEEIMYDRWIFTMHHLIPSRLFTGWLPNSFIDDYTHWYNQSTGSIEFRPTGDPWKPSTQDWILSQHKRHWKLTLAGNISLLSPGSSSASYIASLLSPLDTMLHLHMLLDAKTGNLEIKVTRLRLEFTLKKGESVIISRQFRGMQIDPNQYIGTLIGFNNMSFLYPSDEAITVELAHNEIDLVCREIFRNSRYQVSGFGAEDFKMVHDTKYTPRDRDTLYDLLSGPGDTSASQNIPDTQEIQYGAEWLSDPKTFLPAYWCRLHFAFQTKPSWINKFQTMIWLATLAYSSKRQASVLQAIMMLPLSTQLAAVPLPVGSLEILVHGATRGFGPGCPEMNLPPRKKESQKKTQKRRKGEFNSAKGRAVTSFINKLAIQWPNSDLVTPHESWFTSYINVSSAMALVKEQWRVWLANLRFRAYLERFLLTFNVIELGSACIPRILRPIYQASATRPRGYISIDEVFRNTSPVIGNAALLNLKALQQTVDIKDDANNKLVDLLDHLDSQIQFDYERRYLSELRKSLLDLGGLTMMQLERNDISLRSTIFESYLQQCKSFVQECYDGLLKAVLPESTCSNLGPDDSSMIIRSIISAAGFHPRACPIFFLQQLGRHRIPAKGNGIHASIQNGYFWSARMISPQDNENSVMQLNMGEGKSSVIVPIAATALSNGSQIADIVYKLARRCMKEGGILMVQPEHLLSFQLMGLECAINGRNEIARPLLTTQRLFNISSRDIVDESDENFSVKFELIYTIGKQRPIEHTPERWVLKTSFPESLDVDDRYPERFPRIRILRSDAEAVILTRLAEFICNTGMSGFPIARQRTQIRNAVNRYISNIDLKPKEIDAVEQSSFWGETTADNILLLRGLLSGGILSFAFGQKRWRVDYGTHPNREMKTRLAVPFKAKDNPTPRSEFSHPDVVIVLTCLSYYYKGLQDEELFEALELLVRSDNPDLEYRTWVESAPGLPLSFRHLTGINIRDRTQCISDVFPHLRYAKGCIDYFLSRMVFAKESREFPHKLSASGWDLGKRKINPTTGFSGTNDSRYILPMDMKQLDLPEQNHTNALVLSHLLRSENGIMLMPKHRKGANLESESLLEMVSQMSSNTRVILDVGAQIIDLDNRQFAETWLKRYHEDDSVQAVVFFNEADELMVLDRSNKAEPLQISPFATQLDQCLVFLDEAHTRGTDLRLPTKYQAAVTLGANLTKDKLVQACMRMRKLGRGQSVMFCIPREIEQRIQAQRDTKSSVGQEISVSDVLCWAISETWRDLRRMVPLWLTQGVRYYEQEALWNEGDQYSHDKETWAKKFLEAEAQSLNARYRPKSGFESAELIKRARPAVKFQFQCRCEEFGLMNFRSSSLQEEQERELSPETEQERQVEQPSHALPQQHSCHPDLRSFIKLGGFPVGSGAFKPAFQALKRTSAVQYFDIREFPTSIWVTEDFSKTVRMENIPDNGMDLFQRPVHWILTSKLNWSTTVSHLVIISPWEAHELMPYIEASEVVTLHLYAPRSNLGFRPLDQLVLYTVPHRPKKTVIPPGMMVELNIFAGQLYLSSFKEYIEVCNKLGLAWSPADDSVVLGPDGFIPPGVNRGNLVNKSGFKKSPVQFIKVLVTKIRRNCEVVEKTHLGKILDGVLLTEEDFEDDVD